MENRTNHQVEEIIDFVESKWKLSMLENAVLDSILYMISDRDVKTLNKIGTLIDESYDDLVEYLPGWVINDILCDSGYIDRKDESELVSALEDLNYNFLNNVTEKELEDAGYITEKSKNSDIVTELQLEEMQELFLKLGQKDREEILERLRW